MDWMSTFVLAISADSQLGNIMRIRQLVVLQRRGSLRVDQALAIHEPRALASLVQSAAGLLRDG